MPDLRSLTDDQVIDELRHRVRRARIARNLPQAELQDMIVELRSLTLGVGSFEWRFDHLQELTGRLAEKVIQAQQAEDAR